MVGKHSDIWIGGGLLAFCVFAAWRTLRIPAVGTGTSAGPAFIPWLMIGAIVVLALAMMARAAVTGRAATPKADNSPEDQDDVAGTRAGRGAMIRIAVFVALLVAYAALFMTLGYLVTTLVVFISGMFLLGERRPLVLVVVPAIITTAIYYGFTELLQVWLP